MRTLWQRFESLPLNQRIAVILTAATGSMSFFWIALIFILILRILYPPPLSSLLLDIENDLQLLLLATNAVVSAKTFDGITHVLKRSEQLDEYQARVLKNQEHTMSAILELLKQRISAEKGEP